MAFLNHIGVAVADMPRVKRLMELLGLPATRSEQVANERVMAHFFELPLKQAHVELLEPTSTESAVAKHLAKRGPGIHHLSFEVGRGKLDELCRTLAAEGFRLVYEEPRLGAHGMRINFLHPSTTGGILIEIMEPGGP
ncbi:MAG: VOC family protein [Bdellovibrionales bacterium]|nr:VOC family protein [Bdellovibrionales bacterium]